MKGHVKIELFDHKTGKRMMREHGNMLTNALACRAGIDANDTLTLYSSEYSIMPLGTKGLGGLLMFDGPLTEDAAQGGGTAIRRAACRVPSTTRYRVIRTGRTPLCGISCRARETA